MSPAPSRTMRLISATSAIPSSTLGEAPASSRDRSGGGSGNAGVGALDGEVAGDELAGAEVAQHRLLGGTAFGGARAAGAEAAARGRVEGRGQLTGDGDRLAGI